MEVLSNELLTERYLVEGNRRQAGISELWEAVDQQLERLVTIQILAESESANPQVCDTFLRHQRAASSIQDRVLFAVYDADVRGERAYSVMQRLAGMPASAVFRPGYSPDLPLALAVTRQIAEGLQRCRQGGLADWVFSPEAVFVDPEGDAHLAIIEGLAAPDGPGDIAGLGDLLRLMLAGNPKASDAQLRAAQVPDAVIALLDRLHPGQNNSLTSAGDVASMIAAIELASTQRTEAYPAGSMVPGEENGHLADAAIDHTQDLSEAPTLVAPVLPGPIVPGSVLPANEIGAHEASGQAAGTPERITMPLGPLGAYVPPAPADGVQIAAQRRRPLPWLLPVALLVLLLVLGFVGLRLFSLATRVEGRSAVSPTSTPVAAHSVLTNVTVPDLRGENFDQATSLIKTMGLSLAPGASDYNATYSAGEIMSQQPAPGEQVLAGSPITVSLSLGPAPAPTVAPKPPPPAPQPHNPPDQSKGKPKKGHK
jgi:hypothetical protein